MFYDVYLALCEDHHEDPYPLAVALGARSNSVVARWKTGSTPRKEMMAAIADHFGVSVSYIYAWMEAIDRYGFCWGHSHREAVKIKARNNQKRVGISKQEYLEALRDEWAALFSRSVQGNGFGLNHPDFRTYVSMLLHQDAWKRKIPAHIYSQLINIYGTLPGIREGTYWLPPANGTKKVPSETDDTLAWATKLSYLSKKDIQLVTQILERLKENPKATRAALYLALEAAKSPEKVH